MKYKNEYKWVVQACKSHQVSNKGNDNDSSLFHKQIIKSLKGKSNEEIK